MKLDHSGVQKSIQTENQNEGERHVKAETQIHLQAIHPPNRAVTLGLTVCTPATLALLPQDLHTCCSLGLAFFPMWFSPCLLCLDNSYSFLRSWLRKSLAQGNQVSPLVNSRLDPPMLYIPSWLLVFFIISGRFPQKQLLREGFGGKWVYLGNDPRKHWHDRGEADREGEEANPRCVEQLNVDKWSSVPLGTSGSQHRVCLSLEVRKARQLPLVYHWLG